MLSHCMIPKWNLRKQRQEEDEGEGNRPLHVQGQLLHNHSSTPLVPMSNWRVAEAMHGLGVGDTLDSTVNQATWHSRIPNLALQAQQTQAPPGMSSTGKWGTTSEVVRSTSSSSLTKKRARPESDQQTEYSICFDSSALSLKTRITEEDSACHCGSENLEDEGETKGEIIGRSHSTRRGRAAAARRRRERINQRMKALQKLVPNARKADQVSMLDEVIEYLKQLQAQVKMMSARNMSQMMMMPPHLQMQQLHLQMSLLARMKMRIGLGLGIGIGLGMLNMSTVARFASQPPLVGRPSISAYATTALAPPAIPNQGEAPKALDAAINNSTPFMNPYCTFLPQPSLNIDLYNKMGAIYWQPNNQTAGSALLPWTHVQGG